jgi:hypothetical protein
VFLRREKALLRFVLTFRCQLDLHLGDCHGGVEALSQGKTAVRLGNRTRYGELGMLLTLGH